jgi:hypothetical protein
MTARPVITIALGAALAAGCADAPNAPQPLHCPSARVALCTDVAHAAVVRAAVADAATRLAPSLAGAGHRAAIAVPLAVLAEQLTDGDVARARDTLASLRSTLARARDGAAPDSVDAADLAAIDLALQEVAGALADS